MVGSIVPIVNCTYIVSREPVCGRPRTMEPLINARLVEWHDILVEECYWLMEALFDSIKRGSPCCEGFRRMKKFGPHTLSTRPHTKRASLFTPADLGQSDTGWLLKG